MATPETEVDLKTPSGEMVTVKVPKGWSDDQIKANLRMKNPELFQNKQVKGVPEGKIEAIPNQGIQNKVSNWLNNLEGDVRHGTATTLPGRLLQAMGARGTDTGVSPAVANQVASPVLGTIKTAQGVAEGNVGKTIGGIAQTATLPSAFVAPSAAENAISKIPSKDWAGKALSMIDQAAKEKSISVSPDTSAQVAMRIKEVAGAGANLPSPVKALVNRVTKLAGKGPISFQEARDIYSNATGRLSPEEMASMSPKMQFWLGRFSQALNQDIVGSLSESGLAPMYQEAMRNYHQGAVIGRIASNAGKAALTGATAAAGYEGAKRLIGNLTNR